jgi:hypothetical protein
MYGCAKDKLFILCEDKISASIMKGVFYYLLPKLRLNLSDIEIGHDGSKDKYPQYAEAFHMFKVLSKVVFVMDGDASSVIERIEKCIDSKNFRGSSQKAEILLLPGNKTPELWLWDKLKNSKDLYCESFGCSQSMLLSLINKIESIYKNAQDKESDRFKNMFDDLCVEELRLDPLQVASQISFEEAKRSESKNDREFSGFIEKLKDIINNWREKYLV